MSERDIVILLVGVGLGLQLGLLIWTFVVWARFRR